MKIYLADLVHSIPSNYVVPLNIAYLAAYSKSIFKNELDISLFKDPNKLLTAIKKEPPDILGLSNYYWNNDINRQIGKYVKNRFPSTLICSGGPGIRTDRVGIKDFIDRNEHVDIYMMFEGEQPFVNFLRALMESGKDCTLGNIGKEIEGCAYLNQEQQLVYSHTDPVPDLEKIPSPYLSGYLDDFLKEELYPLLETNRGCPFSCTYCTWGISALKKVRKFSIERVYEEIDYINRINPNLPLWIFADANFGLFERDELIAAKMRKTKDCNPSIRRVVVWGSGIHPSRNLEISKHLGDLQNCLIATQSLDPVVLKNIKRSNDKDGVIQNTVEQVKAVGGKVTTDILLGLPGETRQSHLKTLRTAFDLGFDVINAGYLLMLPGSELETDKSRQRYGIQTKYRLIQGSYGVYQGIKSLEAEESVRATSAMTEDDIAYFRLPHWLIWFGWNYGFLAPLLKYLRSQNIHPLDIIIELVDVSKEQFRLTGDLFDRFRKDAKEEWFATEDDLRKHYLEKQNFDGLLKDGFSKLSFQYTAELMLNRDIYLDFIDCIKYVTSRHFSSSSPIPLDIFKVMEESLIDVYEVSRNSKVRKKSLRIPTDLLPFILREAPPDKGYKGKFTNILLSKEPKHVEALRKFYRKFHFNQNKRLTIEKTLEYFIDGFVYDISAEK